LPLADGRDEIEGAGGEVLRRRFETDALEGVDAGQLLQLPQQIQEERRRTLRAAPAPGTQAGAGAPQPRTLTYEVVPRAAEASGRVVPAWTA